jgi:hypothetical protein
MVKKQFTPSEYRLIYDEARKYLLTLDNVNDALIDKYLNECELDEKPGSIEDLLLGMLNSVTNRQGMRKKWGSTNEREWKSCGRCLFDFEPKRIITEFPTSEEVFKKIKDRDRVSS